ncbi:hypothetical protein BLAHAN_05215 [Blautia hansenii DSM 20583]|uniref:Uncharacterized protein n=1 Tax=Blautia hansenii DSM 20583 TaxID=537007 RepID=C9L754_BLAHA|nr:hypothetical protein BLAHAN_05215 [Blautia hansenii DSM 20583]
MLSHLKLLLFCLYNGRKAKNFSYFIYTKGKNLCIMISISIRIFPKTVPVLWRI